MCGWLWNKWCLGNGPRQISGAALLPPVPASEAKSLPLSEYLICFLAWTQKKGQALTLQVSATNGNKVKTDGWSVRRRKPLNLCLLVKTQTGHSSRFVLRAISAGSVSLPGLHAVKCQVPFAPTDFSRADFQPHVQPSLAWKPPPWSSSVPRDKGLQGRYLERKRTLL